MIPPCPPPRVSASTTSESKSKHLFAVCVNFHNIFVMTRFARAKGSKASNERVPEAATSWHDMKKNLLQKDEVNEALTGDLNSSGGTFNNNAEKQIAVRWSEFPDMHQTDCKSKLKTNKQSANQKKISEDAESPAVSQKKKKRKQHRSDLKCFEDTSNHIEEQTQSVDAPDQSSDNIQKKKKHKHHKSDTAAKHEKQSFEKKGHREEYKRRKPNSEINKIFINGNEIEIAYYDGFPIKKIDAERLKGLKKEMISKGLPRSEVAKALKLERRKAEKSLAREKKKVCFNCRISGHTLSECPLLKSGSNAQLSETGICFKCGSTEHTHFECKVTRGDNFKFAQCFICQEQGHIARQCPDNSKGLYPKGGACRICGDVTHLKKDCPKFQLEQEENKVVAHTIDDQNIESLENEHKKPGKKAKNFQKVIKF